MKQIKLAISLTIGVGALLVGLTGCGSNGSSNGTEDTAAANSYTSTASVVVSHYGVSYQTVTSPYTGKIWLDRNLGATRVCTSFDDEQCYGDLYQWGRDASGHEKLDSQTTLTRANTVTGTSANFIMIEEALDPTTETYDWVADGVDDSGEARRANWSKTDASSVCPMGFRVPTADELRAETTEEGVGDRDDAFNNFLKIPSAGQRYYYEATYSTVGSRGYLWASDINDGDYRAQRLQLTDITALWIGNVRRASSSSIRCITDYTSVEEIPQSRETQTGTSEDGDEVNSPDNQTPVDPSDLNLDAYHYIYVYINVNSETGINQASTYNSNPDFNMQYTQSGTSCTDFGFTTVNNVNTTNGVITSAYADGDRFCWDIDYTNGTMGSSGDTNIVMAWDRD